MPDAERRLLAGTAVPAESGWIVLTFALAIAAILALAGIWLAARRRRATAP